MAGKIRPSQSHPSWRCNAAMTREPPIPSPPTDHEPRLGQALRALLRSTRVAALGTMGEEAAPFVSMVPFARVVALAGTTGTSALGAGVVLHVSGLAPHTRNLERSPQVSLMVMQPEVAGEPVHALPRVSFQGLAHVPQVNSPPWHSARQAYLQRFPEAEPMTALGDFRFVWVELLAARQVAGFGAARALDADALADLLSRD